MGNVLKDLRDLDFSLSELCIYLKEAVGNLYK